MRRAPGVLATWMAMVGGALVGGCLTPLTDEGDDGFDPPPPECDAPEDCSHLVAAGDPCFVAHCSAGTCQVVMVTSTQCQCQTAADCGAEVGVCGDTSCVDYQCVESILPAGLAPTQAEGDCATWSCDGVSDEPVVESALDDLPDDDNECTSDACGASGPMHETAADGTSCGGGFCFEGACLACNPTDPAACGAEGPDEPQNDSGSSPTAYARYGSVCGFLDASDVDWYTFFLEDEDFVEDILNFQFWSTAPTLEVCAYVSCQNGGTPDGGCSDKIPGPGGSSGCCWSGPPDALAPSWDLDCIGSSEDSGTVAFSVRAIGGDACDSYGMSADY